MSSRDVGKDIHQTPDRESPSSSPPSASSEPTWPKGWRPWTSLFGCFLLMWNSWGLINAYGTFESYYQQHLLPGRDLHLWNMVGSTQSFMILSFSFVVGRICDAGHSKALMITGSLLVTVGMFLLSVVNGHGTEGEGNYGLIWFTQGFVQGLGMSCFFVTSSTVAATWFVNKKPTAIGIVASGASIAGLVYPTMTTFTIKYLGFNNAIRAIAGLIGCTCLISVLLAVPNPAHEFHSPEKWLNVRVWVDPRAFRHPPFCWLTASISFMFLGFYAIFFNIEGWAAYYGFGRRYQPPGLEVDLPGELRDDAIETFWLLAVLNVSSTIGRLSSAGLAERFGTLKVHTSALTIGSLLILILWTQASTLSPALAFVISFGAISGAIIGLPPASVDWIISQSDARDHRRLGQWVGQMYTCSAVFALTGPLIAGHLVTEYHNKYISVQLWSGCCLLIAAACMTAAWFSSSHGKSSLNNWRGCWFNVMSTEKKGGHERPRQRA